MIRDTINKWNKSMEIVTQSKMITKATLENREKVYT